MITEYLRPGSVEEAFETLVAAGPAGRLVGGGTDLTLHPPAQVTTLIDLSKAALGGIREEGDGVSIGATVTLTEMSEYEPFGRLWSGVIHAMLERVASPLHRNAASIGGHLARGRLSDVVPVLLAIDAQISLYDGSTRTMPLAEFYSTRANRQPVVVTGVRVSTDEGKASFVKFARTTYDLAILNVACAARFDGRTVSWARIVVGERPQLATEVKEASSSLVGEALTAEAISTAAAAAERSVEVRSDPRASAEYRRHLTGVLVRRCLAQLEERG
jgi:CO/xanthine dehydrogenase FAD-binding subunit